MSKLICIVSAALVFALQAPAFAQERGKGGKILTFCDGGAQEAAFTNTENGGSTNLNGAGVIPGTSVPGGVSGAGSDSDTYTVTFSAETRHTGGGGTLSVQAQVSVNGGAFVNMNPIGPNLFHTGTQTATHTMTWC